MSTQTDQSPVARLDFVGKGSHAPGWYVRYTVRGQPISERLPIEVGADAFGAVDSAAHYLGCRAEQIAVGGPVWPEPLDGMVDAGGTLEFVSDLIPGLTDREGEWQILGEPHHQNDNKKERQHARREVDGVFLYLPIRGRVVDWSEYGMGIEITRPLRISTRFLFEAKGKKSKMELYGEVRWCRSIDGLSLDETGLYRAGVTLIG